MKTLETMYWLRLGTGIAAALACVGYGLATGTITSTVFSTNTFINGLSIALITYILSYYILKLKFVMKVEKPQQIVTTGIGIYFLSWIVLWALLYTILAGPPPEATL